MSMLDYWEFPAVARTFLATGYGKLYTDDDGHRWRKRGGDYVLLSKPVYPPVVPPDANRDRIRSLTWTAVAFGDSVPRIPAGKTYAAPADWVQPNDGRVRNAMNKARREGLTVDDTGQDKWELTALLDLWVQDKREHKPTTIVVRGHYAAMIEDPGIRFLRYRDSSGALLAALGYTEAEGTAAVCFTKHVYGLWWLPRYVWITALRRILDGGSIGVVCGDTADELKRGLGLQEERTYRVDFRCL